MQPDFFIHTTAKTCEAPAETTITSDSAEETEDDGSATKEERRETAKRILDGTQGL